MLLLDLKGNVLAHLYHLRHFLVKALILSQLETIFVLSILNLGRTRDWRGGEWVPSLIRFFLNFSKMIHHQHLPFSVALRISKFGENRLLRLQDMTS